jgi:hypothetical protein
MTVGKMGGKVLGDRSSIESDEYVAGAFAPCEQFGIGRTLRRCIRPSDAKHSVTMASSVEGRLDSGGYVFVEQETERSHAALFPAFSARNRANTGSANPLASWVWYVFARSRQSFT